MRSVTVPPRPTALAIAAIALLVPLCSAPAGAADNLGAAFRPQGGESVAGPAADEANSSGVRVVLVGANRRVATIDGRVVRVGEQFNGLRVTRITLHEVVLAGEDGSIERLLVNPAVALSKRPSPASARDVKDIRP